MDVLGYRLCTGCGTAVLNEVGAITGGLCATCGLNRVPPREKLVLLDGADVAIPRRTRRERKGARTIGERKRQKLLDGAKRRAMARLRDAHREEYLSLLADERRKLGLDPFPVQWATQEPSQV